MATNLMTLKAEKDSLSNSIANLTFEREQLRSATNYLSTEMKRLAGSETNASKLLSELLAEKAQTKLLSGKLDLINKEHDRMAEDISSLALNTMFLESIKMQADRLEVFKGKVPSDTYKSFYTNLLHELRLFKPVTNFVDYLFLGSHWKVEPTATNAPLSNAQQ